MTFNLKKKVRKQWILWENHLQDATDAGLSNGSRMDMHLIYSTSGCRRWNKYSYSVADISICLCLLSVTCFVYSFPGTFPETRPAWGDREGPGPLSRSGLLSAPVVLEGFPFITATWGGDPKGSPSMGPPKEKLVWLLNSQTFGYSLRSHSQTHCKKKKKKKRNVAACSTQLSTCRKMLHSCCETTWCWLSFYPSRTFKLHAKCSHFLKTIYPNNFFKFLIWYDLVFNRKHSARLLVTQSKAWSLTGKTVP